MNSSNEIESLVREAFEDVALLIGGAAALHQLEDKLVRTLIRRLEQLRWRALSRLTRIDDRAGRVPEPGVPHQIHPAIEGFLLRDFSGRDARDTGPVGAGDRTGGPDEEAGRGGSGAIGGATEPPLLRGDAPATVTKGGAQ